MAFVTQAKPSYLPKRDMPIFSVSQSQKKQIAPKADLAGLKLF